jgi:pimeloyl-ACP methyl ester carboxylesterase
MSTFVLVHGAWHGGWCWHKVVARLEKAGHRALAPDLPSLGADKTPLRDVTPTRWAEHVRAIVAAQAEPVVLVGHSRGGMVISQVAEAVPDRIATLVYLSACLPVDGESLVSALQSPFNAGSLILPNMVVADDGSASTIHEAALRDAFYGQCSDDDVALARLLLQPEAMAPLVVPVHVTPQRFGSVRRVYIECLRDRALLLALQREMQRRLPCQAVRSMDTDHSPFFSAPDALVEHLIAFAA